MSRSTERAYRADFADFAAWCDARRCAAMPADPAEVAAYLTDLARRVAPATVARRLAGISAAHRHAALPSPRRDPRVRHALATIEWHYRRRRRPTAPLDVESLTRMSVSLPTTLAGRRDRALLLIAYGAALRRTELVALDVDDLHVGADGALEIRTLRGPVVIPRGPQPHLCASRAWLRWVTGAGLRGGPAFAPIDRHGNVGTTRLSDRAVNPIVRRAAAGAGLDPARWSGRSLRLGLVLAAAAAGATDAEIMQQTGHRSGRLVREYRTRSRT